MEKEIHNLIQESEEQFKAGPACFREGVFLQDGGGRIPSSGTQFTFWCNLSTFIVGDRALWRYELTVEWSEVE